jgi:two-component system, NtrC family, sensor kinase
LIEGEREKAVLDANLIQSSKMAALGKMAAGIAHEVNNPLAVIKEKAGWIKDILEEEDIESNRNYREIEDAMNKIEIHVDRAKKITQRLLGFARRMEPTRDMVNVNRILEETVTFLENEALFRNIRIEKHLIDELPATMSDAAQIQQVFLNILNNALDAVGKNGQVTISTSYNSKQNGEVVISFTDTGPGIPKDVIQKIFDPFFTTKAPGDGTGLGLAISYSIIQKLGGRIMVASAEGQGATFTIYLPVVERPKE